jgi:hypothetical protein
MNRQKNSYNAYDEILPQDELINFYKYLYSCEKSPNNFQSNIVKEFTSMKGKIVPPQLVDDLNKEISTDEILEAIQSIRNAFSDMISNEMLKYAIPILLKPIKKLFNYIIETGQFPKIWNESFLVLLHKKGEKNDPNNYRGISINSSNLGNLFNKIIYKRLLKSMSNKKIISKNQIGFKEKGRTTDHIFTLKTITDQYK